MLISEAARKTNGSQLLLVYKKRDNGVKEVWVPPGHTPSEGFTIVMELRTKGGKEKVLK
jgi:hypothetical protein